ncbi:MAG: mannosyltransferase, partial [Bacteroidia bacterium]|nr:mannosyltransferase [Bacteroidia bacterium]NNM15627.1 mannosyltransferase [Bacteroidia bacterium]
YLIREVGYLIYDYNIIKLVGHWIPFVVVLIVLGITAAIKKLTTAELIKYSLLFLSIHFFFATTVHPWYINTLVALSIFGFFRYPIIWSAMAILSYSAYANEPFSENLTFLTIGYLCVFGAFFYELATKKGLFNPFPVTPQAQ